MTDLSQPDQSQPTWPTMTEYQEAIQSPKLCFENKELRKGQAVTNTLGLPRPVSGQFASVYELDASRSKWAIKCFLRNTPDLHSRYASIAEPESANEGSKSHTYPENAGLYTCLPSVQ